MRSARSGSVAASVAEMPLSADAFEDSSRMELAMRSARSGSVAASVAAMPLSADAFETLGMELAMRSARSGSVAASAFAMPLSADALKDSSVMELGDAFGVSEEPGGAVGVGGCQRFRDVAQRPYLEELVGDGAGRCVRRGRGRWLPASPRRRAAPMP